MTAVKHQNFINCPLFGNLNHWEEMHLCNVSNGLVIWRKIYDDLHHDTKQPKSYMHEQNIICTEFCGLFVQPNEKNSSFFTTKLKMRLWTTNHISHLVEVLIMTRNGMKLYTGRKSRDNDFKTIGSTTITEKKRICGKISQKHGNLTRHRYCVVENSRNSKCKLMAHAYRWAFSLFLPSQQTPPFHAYLQINSSVARFNKL